MLVSTLLAKAAQIFQDVAKVRWKEDELVGWLNDGQREVVMLRADAYCKNESILLAANTTKQALPVGGIRWLDVIRNMGTTGNLSGGSVRMIEREVMDASLPSWHNTIGATEIKHFMFDPRDPKHVYVWPKPHATVPVYVEASYSANPPDCALPSITPTAVIALDDIYSNALLDYILYRGFSKTAEYSGQGGRAAVHYQAFATSLGFKTKVDTTTQPAAFKERATPDVAKTGSPG